MCNAEIITIAEKIKNKEMSRFGEIYEEFGGLIHHYEIKLGYDDAGQELTVFLLELIYTLDTDRFLPDDSESLHRYIAASLRNKYIALSKRARRHMLESGELYDCIGCEEEYEGSVTLKDGIKTLSERQRTIIILKYIYGYSDTEIANRIGITRQAVNRIQRRALGVLREYFEGEQSV